MTQFKTDSTLSLTNAADAYKAGLEQISDGATSIDCALLSQFDSSALAVLLAWQRVALARGVKLTILNLPRKLSSLAQAYGIDQLLTVAAHVDAL